MRRRDFLRTTGLAGAGLYAFARPAAVAQSLSGPASVRVGMCDWNLNATANPEAIAKAAAAGLGGVQVSVATNPDHVPLRDPEVRRAYREAAATAGIAFPSVAAGGILNQIPLMSEPQSSVYVIDAVEAAADFGSTNILIAFFSNGDLRLRDDSGNHRVLREDPFRTYELNTTGVTRVVEALRQIAPRAEAAGVILGLENTLTAEQNLDILDRVGSEMVQVYYDVGNSTSYGYDVPGEIRRLGRDRICEIHIKETLGLQHPEWGLLSAPKEGGVNFPAAAAACRDIGYEGWYVLETSGRRGQFEEDTRENIDFVRGLFGA